MCKIRFRDVKKAIIDDYKLDNRGWDSHFALPFISELKSCKCNEDVIKVLMQNGFTYAEALEQIVDLVTTK